MRFAVVLAEYLENHAIKLASAEQALAAAEHLLGHFRGCTVAELTVDAFEGYVAARSRRGISEATISRELSVMRAALRRAVRRGVLRFAPHVPEPRQYEPRERWLTPQEARELLAECRSPHLRLFVILALHTAARPSAITELRWSQVDFERRILALNPVGRRQTSKRRPTIRMSETLFEILSDAYEVAETDFVIEYHGRPAASVKKSFRDAVRIAGLADVVPYTLRHTAATWMAQQGVPMWEIAGLMGHTSTRMVERVYAKHHPDYMRRATAALDSVLGIDELRADCVPVAGQVPRRPSAKSLKGMVGTTGIEPVTPTMST